VPQVVTSTLSSYSLEKDEGSGISLIAERNLWVEKDWEGVVRTVHKFTGKEEAGKNVGEILYTISKSKKDSYTR
jgi:hypothetical protein